jgi:hypothetical protein
LFKNRDIPSEFAEPEGKGTKREIRKGRKRKRQKRGNDDD